MADNYFYIPKHFKIYELVPKDLFEHYKKRQYYLWGLFDYRTLVTADNLRKRYGKMTINDWYWGGSNQYRGFRPPDCTVGAALSQHKMARALDMIPKSTDAYRIRNDILNDSYHEDFKYITCLEIDISWLHFDVRNYDKQKNGILQVIRP